MASSSHSSLSGYEGPRVPNLRFSGDPVKYNAWTNNIMTQMSPRFPELTMLLHADSFKARLAAFSEPPAPQKPAAAAASLDASADQDGQAASDMPMSQSAASRSPGRRLPATPAVPAAAPATSPAVRLSAWRDTARYETKEQLIQASELAAAEILHSYLSPEISQSAKLALCTGGTARYSFYAHEVVAYLQNVYAMSEVAMLQHEQSAELRMLDMMAIKPAPGKPLSEYARSLQIESLKLLATPRFVTLNAAVNGAMAIEHMTTLLLVAAMKTIDGLKMRFDPAVENVLKTFRTACFHKRCVSADIFSRFKTELESAERLSRTPASLADGGAGGYGRGRR